MKQVLAIIGMVLLSYGTFSTLFHDTSMVGNIGKKLGEENLRLFGYLAYVNFPLLFYPLFRFYRDPSLLRRLDGYVGWLLFFLSFVVLQPLVVGVTESGLLGRELYVAMIPYIGKAGLWLFWLMIFLLSLTLLIEEGKSPVELYERVHEKFSSYLDKRRKRKRIEEKPVRKALKDTTVKKWEMPEISFAWLRRIFRNPFDHKAEKEVEKILSMELEPIEEETTLRPVKRISKGRRGREEKELDDLIRYKRSLEENLDHEEAVLGEEAERAKSAKRLELAEPLPVETKQPQRLRKKRKEAPDKKEGTGSPTTTVTKQRSGVEIVNELEENSKLLADLEKGKREKPKNFKLPRIDFLQKPPRVSKKVNEAEIDRKIGELLDKLERFKIEGDVIRTYTGPLVTTFEFKPAPNVKVSKILGLQDDLAMALSAETIRIQAPIPGRDVVGIEIPNESPATIYLREILESDLFKNSKSPLTVALGKDIVGNPFVTDLKKLPHLLIAGTTGSGKSVGINAMLLSLLYRNDPDHLKLMLIDPKMLEFSIYNDIPHLLTPVIIEPKKAISALANMVSEMERRYKVMSESRVKNIDNYNEKARQEGWEQMPFIVIVIDELADLMMNGGKEVEYSIARLAQMARAAGIHLIVATQRPSVDVVTGLIKANLPSRLSYRVGQRIDSKVILDQLGAESLLGRGDALFTPPGSTGLVRLHAPWNSEEEIEEIVEFLKAQREPEYDIRYLDEQSASGEQGSEEMELDPLYEQAKEIVLTDKKTSISYLQRRLQIGYNRSANLIDQLERTGILSAPNAKGGREILV
ncbi:DNA translocase FtsK 4TM domain-containing protein [Nitratifractor sp.]